MMQERRHTLSRKAERTPSKMANPPLPQAGEGWGEGGWKTIRYARASQSKRLRQNQTEAEKKLWHEIKAKRFNGLKFKRQYSIGPYYTDFACPQLKLFIEIDGGQHCENAKDQVRSDFLEREGYTIIRFWNNEVLSNIEGVLSTLSLTLSRKAGEGIKKTGQRNARR